LVFAVLNQRLEIVRDLLAHGADIHLQDHRAFIQAIRNKDIPIIQEFLLYGADLEIIRIIDPRLESEEPYMMPIVIRPREYYQVELSLEAIRETPSGYTFQIGKQVYIV
jgi:hypothetical protein